MLLGQYSVGKSTFIKYLLEGEYPGAHIGPEPTTDRFMCKSPLRSVPPVPSLSLALGVRLIREGTSGL